MIVDDSFNYHARLKHELSFTIINYHQLSCSLDVFKFDMIVHDSFFRLTKRMIVHDSFSVSGGNQGGLNAKWLPHCHRPVKNNKAIIWTNIRTTVTLTESEKVRKAKRSKKPGNKKCNDSLIWDTRPGHVCGTFFAFVAAQQFFTNAILHCSH